MNDIAPRWNDDTLVSAKTRHDVEIAIYDDCFGPLWVCQNSLGVFGVIRARSWETAYSIMEDEILKPIPEEDVIEAYGYYTISDYPLHPEKRSKWTACKGAGEELGEFLSFEKAVTFCLDQIQVKEVELVEGYSYQDNATGTGIVCHDLNGETINALTPELIEHLGLVIEAEDPDGNRYCVTSKGDEDESNNPTTDPAVVSDND